MPTFYVLDAVSVWPRCDVLFVVARRSRLPWRSPALARRMDVVAVEENSRVRALNEK
jgi:hypothetical protein